MGGENQLKIDSSEIKEVAEIGEYIYHFNVHYNILLRRYQRFIEIDEPLNDDIDIFTYFDMVIVQLRALCIEIGLRKSGQVVSHLSDLRCYCS